MNNKKTLFIGLTFVLSIIILIAIMFFTNGRGIDINDNNMQIYYYDIIEGNLKPESIVIRQEDDIIHTIFDEMENIPKSSKLSGAIPNDIELLTYSIEDEILDIHLSSNYNELKDAQKLILNSSLVWTYTELDYIKGVKIIVNGENVFNKNNIDYLTRNLALLNPIISPEKIETAKVTLYFANKEHNILLPESRIIEISQSKTIEYQIIEELMKGSKEEGFFATIPEGTKIKNIKTEDGICYVDLSSDFVTKYAGGEEKEFITIYSVVNSLTELEEIEKVQILIEGDKIEVYSKFVQINSPLDRNETLIEK